jgi:hypothetical protein
MEHHHINLQYIAYNVLSLLKLQYNFVDLEVVFQLFVESYLHSIYPIPYRCIVVLSKLYEYSKRNGLVN